MRMYKIDDFLYINVDNIVGIFSLKKGTPPTPSKFWRVVLTRDLSEPIVISTAEKDKLLEFIDSQAEKGLKCQ